MAKKTGKSVSVSEKKADPVPQTTIPSFPNILAKEDLTCQTLLADQIMLVDNFLSVPECKAFVKMIDTLPLELTPPKKRGEAERVNYRFSVQSLPFAQKLHSLLVPHLSQLDSADPERRPVACNSNIRMYKYTPSQYFGPHYDDSVTDPQTGNRSEWTVLVYLTGVEDGVEGGETLFYKTEKMKANDTITAPLTRGTVLIHRHGHQCMFHEGSKVLKGTKYILRSDLMFSS